MIKYVTEFEMPTEERRVLRHGVEVEDGGQSARYICPEPEGDGNDPSNGEFFIELGSWDETVLKSLVHEGRDRWQDGHAFLRSLLGKRVRVTVEVIDG